MQFYSQNSQFELDTPSALELNKYQLVECKQDPSTQQATVYKNGTPIQTGGAGAIINTIRTSNFIGRSNWGDPLFQGDIAEVLLFDHALSDSDRQTWENYLNARYQFNPPPPAPTQLLVTPLSASQVVLSWSENYQTVGGYVIERQNADGSWSIIATVEAGVTTYIDGGLTPGTSYAYRITATNSFGNSPTQQVTGSTAAADDDGPLATNGMRLWLQADAGTVVDANGRLSAWTDQSGGNHSATQSSDYNRPLLVPGALNGQPILRFDRDASFLYLPDDLFSGVGAAEVFVVVRAADPVGGQEGLWCFTDRDNAFYPENDHLCETFGTQNRYAPLAWTAPLDQFNLYNVSAALGAWTARMDGQVLCQSSSNTVDFSARSYRLGQTRDGQCFAGDIAELIIFDHALSDGDRRGWSHYLNAKYHYNPAPAQPGQVQVDAASSTQLAVSWTEASTGVDGYSIERQGADGIWNVVASVDGNVSHYLDGGLTPAKSYSYRVTATNNLGASPVSDVGTGMTGPAVAANDVFPVNGLRLWLQADTGVGLDPNQAVSTWADQSGGNHAASQGSGGIRPSLAGNVAHGHAAVHFDANGAYLRWDGNLMDGVTAAEIFAVVRATDPLVGVDRGIWQFNGWQGFGSGCLYPVEGQLYETFGSSASRGPMTPPAPLDQFNLYNVAAAPGAWTARMNGQVMLDTQDNVPDFTGGNFLLGISGWGGSSFAGDIAELFVFDHVLSPTERAAVERYCATRYELNGYLLGDGNADPDGDGLTNYQEYLAGTDPLDYYNGQTPLIAIASGNEQPAAAAGAFVAQPLRVEVTSSGGTPLPNAPVVFAVTRGSGLLADPVQPSVLVSSLTLRTGADGVASILFQPPSGLLARTSFVTATAGTANRINHVTFAEAIVADDDSSGDGLPDGWKLQYGLDLTTNDANDDPDGDGLTNLQEFYLGTNPNVADVTADGVPVGWLVAHGMDPRYDNLNAIDPNGGGLTYLQEFRLQQSTVDLWKFDEGGQSATATSSSGYKDVGLLTGDSIWTVDPDGGSALSFGQAGTTVLVASATDGHLDFAAQQSFSVTARFQTTAAGTPRFVGKGVESISGAPGYLLGLINGAVTAGIGSGDVQSPSLRLMTAAAFNDGQWHHVAAVFDRSASQASLYVDGILQAVTTGDGSAGVGQGMSVDFSTATGLSAVRPSLPLLMGATDLSGTDAFSGTMDNVGLFSKALTEAEVKALAGSQNNVAPSVAIDQPLPAAEFPETGDIVIRAEAASTQGTIRKVEFFNGTSKLGEADTYPYTITWPQVPIGTYALIAKATDIRGASATSAPVSIVVSADSDHDGLPDDWEMRYFGNLDQDANGSYLNDGMSNLTKYLLGIDPTKPVTTDNAAASTVGLQVYTPLQ